MITSSDTSPTWYATDQMELSCDMPISEGNIGDNL